jgi:hypothetical protein
MLSAISLEAITAKISFTNSSISGTSDLHSFKLYSKILAGSSFSAYNLLTTG